MNTPKKAILGASVATLLVGGSLAVGLAVSAGAATPTPSPTSSSTTDAPDTTDGTTDTGTTDATDTDGPDGQGTHDPSQGGHVGKDGTVEALLTGSTADSVKAAVLAANPGATIERMENDAEGATYEAHIVKADGTHATVKLDASFAITGTETGRN